MGYDLTPKRKRAKPRVIPKKEYQGFYIKKKIERVIKSGRHDRDYITVVNPDLNIAENNSDIVLEKVAKGRFRMPTRVKVDKKKTRSDRPFGNKIGYIQPYQLGPSHLIRDKGRMALPPGQRISKTGNIYVENRKNRSDLNDGI